MAETSMNFGPEWIRTLTESKGGGAVSSNDRNSSSSSGHPSSGFLVGPKVVSSSKGPSLVSSGPRYNKEELLSRVRLMLRPPEGLADASEAAAAKGSLMFPPEYLEPEYRSEEPSFCLQTPKKQQQQAVAATTGSEYFESAPHAGSPANSESSLRFYKKEGLLSFLGDEGSSGLGGDGGMTLGGGAGGGPNGAAGFERGKGPRSYERSLSDNRGGGRSNGPPNNMMTHSTNNPHIASPNNNSSSGSKWYGEDKLIPNGNTSPRKFYTRVPFDDWRKATATNTTTSNMNSIHQHNASSSFNNGGGGQSSSSKEDDWRTLKNSGNSLHSNNNNNSSSSNNRWSVWRSSPLEGGEGAFRNNGFPKSGGSSSSKNPKWRGDEFRRRRQESSDVLPEWAHEDLAPLEKGSGGTFDSAGKFTEPFKGGRVKTEEGKQKGKVIKSDVNGSFDQSNAGGALEVDSKPISHIQPIDESPCEDTTKRKPPPNQEPIKEVVAPHSSSRGPPPPGALTEATTPEEEEIKWIYLDPEGKTQGAFPSIQMLDWLQKGYFPPDLRLRRTVDKRFIQLSELTKMVGVVPFLPGVTFPPLEAEDEAAKLHAQMREQAAYMRQLQAQLLMQQILSQQQQPPQDPQQQFIPSSHMPQQQPPNRPDPNLLNKLVQILGTHPNGNPLGNVPIGGGGGVNHLLGQSPLDNRPPLLHPQEQQVLSHVGSGGIDPTKPLLSTQGPPIFPPPPPNNNNNPIPSGIVDNNLQKPHSQGPPLLAPTSNTNTVAGQPNNYDPIKSLLAQLNAQSPANNGMNPKGFNPQQQQNVPVEGGGSIWGGDMERGAAVSQIWNKAEGSSQEQQQQHIQQQQQHLMQQSSELLLIQKQKEELAKQEELLRQEKELERKKEELRRQQEEFEKQQEMLLRQKEMQALRLLSHRGDLDPEALPNPPAQEASEKKAEPPVEPEEEPSINFEDFVKPKSNEKKDRKQRKAEEKRRNRSAEAKAAASSMSQQKYIPGMEGSQKPSEPIVVRDMNHQEVFEEEVFDEEISHEIPEANDTQEEALDRLREEQAAAAPVVVVPKLAPWATTKVEQSQLSLAEIQKIEAERERLQKEARMKAALLAAAEEEEKQQQQQHQMQQMAPTMIVNPLSKGKWAPNTHSEDFLQIVEEEARLEKARQEKKNNKRSNGNAGGSSAGAVPNGQRTSGKESLLIGGGGGGGSSGGSAWGSGGGSSGLSWASKTSSNIPQLQAQQQAQQQSRSVKNVIAPSSSSSSGGGGFWDDSSSSSSAAPPGGASMGNSQQQPPKAVNTSNNAKKNKKAGGEKSSSGDKKQQSPFEDWCTNTLKSYNVQVDIPTFLSFLESIESPYEVNDYISSYIGEGKGPKSFAKEYLERRSKWRNSLKTANHSMEDNLMAPANAINPRESSSDFTTVRNSSSNNNNNNKSRGKRSKGAGKGGKVMVDMSHLLGFSVASDRVNAGELDLPQ